MSERFAEHLAAPYGRGVLRSGGHDGHAGGSICGDYKLRLNRWSLPTVDGKKATVVVKLKTAGYHVGFQAEDVWAFA